MDSIVIRGAREHNLKNIDVVVPRNKFVVITGVSGSGKSSLAFDTIFAEGQRRYVESLSAYARQFLEQMEKPDVDSIEGLSPAISIEQRTTSRNPRSTVGTVTEIYDYLRLLYASVGTPHCTSCGQEIRPQTIQQMVDRLMKLRGRHEVHGPRPLHPRKEGGVPQADAADGEGRLHPRHRQRRDGRAGRSAGSGQAEEAHHRHRHRPPGGQRRDRTAPRGLPRDRHARDEGSGQDPLQRRQARQRKGIGGEGNVELLSQNYACPDCGVSIGEITPRLFSFNSPYGACTGCSGLGVLLEIDEHKIVPDPERSIEDGAIAIWKEGAENWRIRQIHTLAKHYKFSVTTPWAKLPEKARQMHPQRLRGEAQVPVPGIGEHVQLHRHVRRARPDAQAALSRVGQRRHPRRDRALHDAEEVPEVQRPATEAGGTCGHGGQSSHRRHRGLPAQRGRGVLQDAGAHGARGAHRRQDPEGGTRPARLPQRRRPRLPHARPQRGHALRRRGAAHPAGHADRLEADGRALRARRALHRPPPARQPQADRLAPRAARPRQHRDRRRARRGDHRDRRPRHRPRTARRRAWRPHRGRGDDRAGQDLPLLAHRPSTCAARRASTFPRSAGRTAATSS